jgi:hypothetical protein
VPMLALSIRTYFGRLATSFDGRRAYSIAVVADGSYLVPSAVRFVDMLAA